MKDVNQLKIGSILAYINIIISMIIPFLYTPIMLKTLGQAEYGLYSLSNSIIGYLSLLNFGMATAIVRYIIKARQQESKDDVEKLMGMFTVIYCILGGLALLIGFMIIPFSNTFFSNGLTSEELNKLKILIAIMTLSTSVSFPAIVFSSVTVAYERFLFRRLFEIILTLLTPILNLVALFMGGKSVGLAISGLLIQIIAIPIYLLYCKKSLNLKPQFKEMPFYLLKEIIKFSAFIFLSIFVDILYWSTDKVLIGSMLGTTFVAIYNIGGTFTSMLQNTTAAISNVFVTRVNEIVFSTNDILKLDELLIRIGRLQYYILALILSGFIVFGKIFIHFWAGDSYLDGYYVAVIVMIPLSIPLIQNIAYNVILAKNKHQFRSVIYLIIAIINLIFTYIFIPQYGIIGAAVCSGVAYFIGNGLIMNGYYYYKIKLNIPLFWKNIIKISIVPILLMILFMILLNNFVFINSIIQFMIFVLIYTILYIVLTWIFSMNNYEKNLFKDMFSKLNILGK